jgi:four helix bundle protein
MPINCCLLGSERATVSYHHYITMNAPKYDLEERTTNFSKEVIQTVQNIQRTLMNQNIISQLLKSTTSICANYPEANAAESGRDFKHKISICKKEAKESRYWLNLLSLLHPEHDQGLKKLM